MLDPLDNKGCRSARKPACVAATPIMFTNEMNFTNGFIVDELHCLALCRGRASCQNILYQNLGRAQRNGPVSTYGFLAQPTLSRRRQRYLIYCGVRGDGAGKSGEDELELSLGELIPQAGDQWRVYACTLATAICKHIPIIPGYPWRSW